MCLPSLADLVNKLESFSHKEFNKPEFTDRSKILKRVRSGVDLFDRRDKIYDRVDNNYNMPSYILQPKNKEQYAYIFNRDPVSGNFKDFCEDDLLMQGNSSWTPPPPKIPHPSQ